MGTLLVYLFCFQNPVFSEVLTDNLAEALIDSNGHAEIPSNYTSIAERAFDGVQALKSVTIPNSITSIGLYAFADTPYLSAVEIPQSVNAILDGVFRGSGIKSITIPSSVTYIGWNNFSLGTNNCDMLEELIIGMSEIPDEAFQNCTALRNITFLDTVTEIGNNSFEGTPITEITFPDSLVRIGSAAFSKSQLISVIIPDSVSSIGDAAFSEAPLDNLILGQSITSIEQTAFAYTGLNSILIPKSVVDIGYQAFYTESLTDIYVHGESGAHSWSPSDVFYENTEVRYCDCTLDLDGNSKFDALTDGLLMLRYIFGLVDDALTTGTLTSDAIYNSSEQLQTRIEQLGTLIDIDGNGEIDALTDGLLILRYLFGLAGETLVVGVVDDNATRNTREIEAYLSALMP